MTTFTRLVRLARAGLSGGAAVAAVGAAAALQASSYIASAERRRNNIANINSGGLLVEDINSAKYYMKLSISQWNGLITLSNTPLEAITELLDRIGLGGLTSIAQYKLPIPQKITDQHLVTWQNVSLTETIQAAQGAITDAVGNVSNRLIGSAQTTVAGGMLRDAATVASIVTGTSPNEFLVTTFKGPSFKEYSFTWTLSPNTPEIARNVKSFLRTLNFAVAPQKSGFLWKYPQIFQLSFYRNDIENPNMYKFKPAICKSLSVDYAGSGIPTFFPDGNPETINITMQFQELEYWTEDDFGGTDW